MKCLMWACVCCVVFFPVMVSGQFLPPGLPLPDNHGEDVMSDHLLDGALIHVVWASNVDHTGTSGSDPDIFYMRHDGSAWSPPVLVNHYGTLDNTSSHDERLPRLALAPDGTLHCVWQSRYPLRGETDWDIMYARLDDTGWSDAETLTWAPLDETLATIITTQDGDPVVVYQNSQGEIRYRVSGGDIWSGDQPLYVPPAGSSGIDVGPVALARSSDGLIVAVWSTTHDLSITGHTMGNDADIVFSELPPNTSHGPWTSPVPVSDHAYGDTGKDINPVVVLLNEGMDMEMHVVWESTSDLVGNGTEGDLLGAVYHASPRVLPSANPTYLVNSNGIGDLHGDHLPSLCAEPGGVVHVAWQTRDAFVGDLDVLHAHNASPGGLWSPFDLLGQNGVFDGPGEDDSRPDIEYNHHWSLSGMWQSTDDLGGWLSGGDHDLFHALGFGMEVSRPAPINPRVDTDTGDELFSVKLVVDPQGTAHAVFHSNEPGLGGYSGPNTDIFYTYNEGTGWSQPELVSNFGIGPKDPSSQMPLLAVNDRHQVHVVWRSTYTQDNAPTLKTYNVWYAVKTGEAWSEPKLVNRPTPGVLLSVVPLDLKVGPGGDPHVIYGNQGLVFTSPLYWSKRTQAGWMTPEQFDTNVDPIGFYHVFGASLWVDPQGSPHVCWTTDADYLGSGSDVDVLYSTRSGNTWSTPSYVNDAWQNDVAEENECALVGLPNGELLMIVDSTLDRNGAGADDYDIFAARMSGRQWRPMQLLLEALRTDANNDFTPIVAIQNNTLIVGWTTQGPGMGWPSTDGDGVFAVLDPSLPFPSTAPLRWVNATALGDNALPNEASTDILTSIAYSAGGRVHFAWGSTLDRLGTGQSDWDAYHAWIDVPIKILDTNRSR